MGDSVAGVGNSVGGVRVLDAARALKVDPARLVAEGLAGVALAIEPADGAGRQALRTAAHQQAAQRLVAEREARACFEALAASGVRAVTWKGLALDAYWTAGLRPIGDLDLLVADDPAPAVVALERLGYRRWRQEPGGLVRRGNTGIVLVPPVGQGLIVDLHTVVFRSVGHRIAIADLVARAQPTRLAGAPTLRLELMDEVHLALVHAAKHALAGLKWRLDLAVLCADLDEEALAARVAQARTGRPVGLALRAIGHPAAARFPLPRWVEAALLPRCAVAAAPLRALDKYLFELGLEEGLGSRARMALGVVERAASWLLRRAG